jgi:cytochrome b561
MRSDSQHYDPVSQAFHWLTAVFVVAAFILGPEGFGRAMRQGLDPATRWDIVTHETLGLGVLVLTLLRLLWALVRPAPPRFDLAPWMHFASKAVQALLWLLMLLLPVTAVLALGSEGHPLTLLGGLRVDRMPWIENASIAHWADWGEVHGLLGDVIIWIAGAHAAAAIFHQLVLKDDVLRSMLPRR